jgi:hypothetical protein
MSELELSLFRQRSQEALKQKASRGALILGVAAGYGKSGATGSRRIPTSARGTAARLEICRVPASVRSIHCAMKALSCQ